MNKICNITLTYYQPMHSLIIVLANEMLCTYLSLTALIAAEQLIRDVKFQGIHFKQKRIFCG